MQSKSDTPGFLSPETRRKLDAIRVPVHSTDEEAGSSSQLVPTLPDWVDSRVFLGAKFLTTDQKGSFAVTRTAAPAVATLPVHVQEVVILDEVINALMGFEGRFIRCQKTDKGEVSFRLDGKVDPSISELVNRILPLCEQYVRVKLFADECSRYEHGLVSHAFGAAITDLLKDYLVFVAQLETLFRSRKLSLQKLWFYAQPPMQTVQILDRISAEAVQIQARGGTLLNLISKWSQQMGGDATKGRLFEHLMRRSSVPYFEMLSAWIYRGIIHDPYGEFLVCENDSIKKEMLVKDFAAEYWSQKYTTRKDQFPRFLEKVHEKILTTGKYLNVVRQCGRAVQCPFEQKISYTPNEREYVEKIERAYDYASKLVLDLLLDEQKLMDRLRSIKHYFFLDKGDFFVHFMDIAEDELAKNVKDISVSRLESFLDLSIRTSVAVSDPYKEDLACVLLTEPLGQQLTKIFMTARPNFGTQQSSRSGVTLSGMDAFALDYRVGWPLSLIINKKAMAKYQLIFRHLFHCKQVERSLCKSWAYQQALKEHDIHDLLLFVYSLRQRMVHFLHNYEYYMMFEVLEPHWHVFKKKMESVQNVDEVMALHNDLLDTCLKACLLTNIHLINRLSKIMRVCLVFAQTTERLYRTLSLPDSSRDVEPMARADVKKGLIVRTVRIQEGTSYMRESLADKGIVMALKKIELDFNSHLNKLVEALNAHAHSTAGETHLTHLCARLDYQQ